MTNEIILDTLVKPETAQAGKYQTGSYTPGTEQKPPKKDTVEWTDIFGGGNNNQNPPPTIVVSR